MLRLSFVDGKRRDQLAERSGSELKEFHIQPMDESGGDGADSR